MIRTLRLLGCLSLLAAPARGFELTLFTNNISLPEGTTFQMPLTASTAATFKVESVSWRAVKAAFAPRTNRSLILNVSGVDPETNFFTGEIGVQLFEDLVPITTGRFIELVHSNHFDGQPFHRVVGDFLCQAGNTNGNTGVRLDDEFERSLIYNGLGQLATANAGRDTVDSEFFITDPFVPVTTQHDWNFTYAIFGQTTRGFTTLKKVINTPAADEVPASPPIINSATITTDASTAVLRLTSLVGFTGQVTVVVSAQNSLRQTDRQTLLVNVVRNTVNSLPFFGPLPRELIITQSMAAAFNLTVTDLNDDDLTLDLSEGTSGQTPTNLQARFNPATGQFWLLPDLSATGTVNVTLQVFDFFHYFFFTPIGDLQQIDLTIVPKPPLPTLAIHPRSGTLLVSPDPLGSRIKLAGTLSFTNNSDLTFGSNDYLILTLGDLTQPLQMTIPPDESGRSTKNGVIRMKSIPGSQPTLAATFDSRKGTFKVTVSNFNFPGPQTNPVIQVGLTIGNDYGTNVTGWSQPKPGTFTYPK